MLIKYSRGKLKYAVRIFIGFFYSDCVFCFFIGFWWWWWWWWKLLGKLLKKLYHQYFLERRQVSRHLKKTKTILWWLAFIGLRMFAGTRVYLFVELHRLGLTPNKMTFTFVLSVLAQSGPSTFGKTMHRYIEIYVLFLYAQTTTLGL